MQIFKTMEKNNVHAKQWLNKCYSDSAPLETMVKRWYADFKCSCTDTHDAECSGHPNLTVIRKTQKKKKLHKLILVDHKLKLHEIAEELKTSEGSAFMIFRNICPWESYVQSGCNVCSQSIKNTASMIQSIVCNCFNATKRSFCINMWQWMKHGSTTSFWSQVSGQQQVKAIQSDQRHKYQQAGFWPP